MADKKISALTGATTPLDGTEVLPIVQSGATVKVAVSNLTAGLSTIPTTKGGTNLTSFTANGVVYASSTSALATGSGILFDGTNLSVGSSSTAGGVFTAGGGIGPSSDNASSCGNASRRWSVIYAGTGLINTSDAREKTAVRALTASEITAAQQLANEIGAYKWLSAINKKGNAAREHIGLTVQRAIEIMEANGLVPFNYGFICHDEWADKFSNDENGDEFLDVAAGSRYSFRMDELGLFIASGQQAMIDQMKADITALQKVNQ